LANDRLVDCQPHDWKEAVLSKDSKRKILVVDDDQTLLREIRAHLTQHGYEVATAVDGRTALTLAKSTALDLVILDITLPEEKIGKYPAIDGIEVLRALRESGEVPILMLSSTNISAVKVMSLTIGADDYVHKPVDLEELTARVDAILRRTKGDGPDMKTLRFSRLKLDPGERRVWKDDILVDVTSVEFDLLYTLASRPNHVFTRDKLLDMAWKESNYSVPKVVDVHIGHIRKKIEDDPKRPAFIVTVRGTGYRFEAAPE
jgi:DNA-binding response OmpR family regulator